MEKNIGRIDQIIRIILAIVFLVLGYMYSVWWLYLIAVILVFTASIRFCGPYKLLGICTMKNCKVKKKKRKK